MLVKGGPESRIFAHGTIHYPQIHKCVWMHWAYQMLLTYGVSSVYLRLDSFSRLSFMQYIGLCVFRLPISFLLTANVYIICPLIIIKREMRIMNHRFRFGQYIYIYIYINCDSGIEDSLPNTIKRVFKHAANWCIYTSNCISFSNIVS